MKKKILIILVFLFIILFILIGLFPKKKYTNEDFNIETDISKTDKDNDGIDDQTDMLNNARKYIETKPKYKSKYYESGYPNDNYGVCTDIVAFGMKNAGYDLMNLVNQDIINSKEKYNIETIDRNIDFRRVKNLAIYFKNNHISLTKDLSNIKEWQGGDIVIFSNHIGVISNKRNKKGIPYLIHHASLVQFQYEEDVLEFYKNDIIGHYRIS